MLDLLTVTATLLNKQSFVARRMGTQGYIPLRLTTFSVSHTVISYVYVTQPAIMNELFSFQRYLVRLLIELATSFAYPAKSPAGPGSKPGFVT